MSKIHQIAGFMGIVGGVALLAPACVGEVESRPEPVGEAALAVGPATAGCADGTREGFTNEVAWPNIAGCSGAWTIPGIHPSNPGIAPACPGLATVDTLTPACGRAAGNTGQNPTGSGCNVADVCAAGWHVCLTDVDVTASSPTGCTGATAANDPLLFFATRQSTNGCGVCADGVDVGVSCNSATCAGGCFQTASTSNDIYGCGNLGSGGACGPLNRFSGNFCNSLGGAPWSCSLPTAADDNGHCEAYTILKSDNSRGGVLCCKDASTCGNGVIEPGEQCDGGPNCDSSCRVVTCVDLVGNVDYSTDGVNNFNTDPMDLDASRSIVLGFSMGAFPGAAQAVSGSLDLTKKKVLGTGAELISVSTVSTNAALGSGNSIATYGHFSIPLTPAFVPITAFAGGIRLTQSTAPTTQIRSLEHVDDHPALHLCYIVP